MSIYGKSDLTILQRFRRKTYLKNRRTFGTILDARPLSSSILAASNRAKVEKLDLDLDF